MLGNLQSEAGHRRVQHRRARATTGKILIRATSRRTGPRTQKGWKEAFQRQTRGKTRTLQARRPPEKQEEAWQESLCHGNRGKKCGENLEGVTLLRGQVRQGRCVVHWLRQRVSGALAERGFCGAAGMGAPRQRVGGARVGSSRQRRPQKEAHRQMYNY